MDKKVRVRFAPSPTGPLHIGGVRTALYNYLFAKKNKGTFILRIEDTDRTRYVQGAEQYILDSLSWLGIEFDEGPGKETNYSPYRQSERKKIYKQYADKLVKDGNAYLAFDTPDELEKMRNNLKTSGGNSQQYDYTTRTLMRNSFTLNEKEVKRLVDSGEHYVVRINIPPDREIKFYDEIRGGVTFQSNNLDDKVLFKSDGMPTYHLANVVDDHLMEITHVIRGEEWLSSTPLHILLYEYLGWNDSKPLFAHLPLILKPDGKGKLSKRDGDQGGFPIFPLEWKDPMTGEISKGYREMGYFKEAVINILMMLGWNPADETEVFSMDELTSIFTLDRVGKSGAKFDPQKAHWFNQHYMREKSSGELAEIFKPYLINAGITTNENYIKEVCSLLKEKLTFVTDFFDYGYYFFTEPKNYDEKIIQKKWNDEAIVYFNTLKGNLSELKEFDSESIQHLFHQIGEKTNLNPNQFFQLFRLILSGVGFGPDLFRMASVLGKEKVLNRVTKALDIFSNYLINPNPKLMN